MVIIHIAIKHNTKIENKRDEDFWEREREANFTRKKPLDDLDYVSIPDDILSLKPSDCTDEIAKGFETLQELSDKKIVNFSGLTNTDLKLAYGTANINILTEYDNNYINLISTLQNLAEALVEDGKQKTAIIILEYAIHCGSDLSKTFFLLADLYGEIGNTENIGRLIHYAENINSVMRESIISTLKQKNCANYQ